ncbi:MAG TPA: gamma-glutamylcyclotransferase family protein [Hanamia sp.]|nr:gamma-glutamylcyclotransferase family protein [Hanamia sp.]
MESKKSDYLFVYSSLREGFRSNEYKYIRTYFNFEGKAKVKGLLSDLGHNPVATTTSQNYFIKGELYRIIHKDDFSFAIGQLDDYEGVNPEADERPLYKREITTVFKEDGSEVEAWIYWFNGNVEGKPVIASGDVMEYIHSSNS